MFNCVFPAGGGQESGGGERARLNESAAFSTEETARDAKATAAQTQGDIHFRCKHSPFPIM